MVDYIRIRQERHDNFLKLFRDVTSELAEGDDTNFRILREGDEGALAQLADKYGLSQDELVFACDALLALGTEVQALTSIVGRGY